MEPLGKPKSREEVTKITLTNARHYVTVGMVTIVGIGGIQAIWRNFLFSHIFSKLVMCFVLKKHKHCMRFRNSGRHRTW